MSFSLTSGPFAEVIFDRGESQNEEDHEGKTLPCRNDMLTE